MTRWTCMLLIGLLALPALAYDPPPEPYFGPLPRPTAAPTPTPIPAATPVNVPATRPLVIAATTQLTTPTPPTSIALPLKQALIWQLALEREGFSPGVLDGKIGGKTALATREYQKANDLPVTGLLDELTATALGIDDSSEPTTTYTVDPADAEKVTGVPNTWPEKAAMSYLGYESLAAAVAEKFHCAIGLLERLNPGVSLADLQAGQVLTVPAVQTKDLPRAGSLEVNLNEKTIRIFDRQGKLAGLIHCSIAADKAKRPSQTARIVVAAANPNYTFDPALWPEVQDVDHKLTIPPGPRNPVGLFWIGLDLPGYGMHGTPHPEQIGKTGSHGCFRLANWDAQRLGKSISLGLEVRFVGSGQ